MNILALDTSTASFYAALKTDSSMYLNSLENNSMQHSEKIIGVIDSLLKEASLSVGELDLLVCTRGPGSFTGLRIAMSALKGISYGKSIPLVSVSTLEAWGEAASALPGLKVAAIDAKKQRYYISAFDKDCLMPDTDGTAADLEEVIKGYDRITVTGPDAQSFSEILRNAYPEKEVVLQDVSPLFPSALIELGRKRYEENGADHIGQGPVYLRKSDAEEALEKRLKEEGRI